MSPVRPRRPRGGGVPPTPRLLLALSLGPAAGTDDSLDDATLRTAWRAFRAYLLTTEHTGCRRPWAWWQFESGIPADLRGSRPQLIDVADADAIERHEAAEADLEIRRAAWLAANSERTDR